MSAPLAVLARRRALIPAIAVVIVAGGALLWWNSRPAADAPLLLYGNIDIREVQLAFRQPGRVQDMAFEEGDAVASGARMATLDPVPYRQALAMAEAEVLAATATLAKLRHGPRRQEVARAREALNEAEAAALDAARNFERQSGLLASGASSDKQVDGARAARDRTTAAVAAAKAALSEATEGTRREDILAGEARLAAAEAARAQAATALADTILLAPASGTILSRVREPGSMVTSQNMVYSLSLDQPVYVRAYVGEPDLGHVAPGTMVEIRTDSSPKTYRGQIGFVSPKAEFTPKSVETTDLRTDLVYRLRVVVVDADRALRQGMPVTVTVGTTRKASPGGASPDGE